MKLKLLAAAAALCVTATSSFALDIPVTLTNGTGFYGATRTAGSFSDNFTFTAPSGNNFANGSVSSINIGGLQDVTFTSVTLTTGAGFGTTVATFTTNMTGAIELRTLAAAPMTAGQAYAITVVGTVTGGSGSYSGTVNVSPVPEPETYALMLAGLAGVGFMARRRSGR